MLAPQGFQQTLSMQAYRDGHMIAAKRQGILHYTFPVLLLAAALIVYGIRAVWSAVLFPTLLSVWIAGGLLILTGVTLAVLWLAVFPRRYASRADRQFALYDALYGTTEVTFTQDDMTLKGVRLTRRIEYAKTRLCVETPALFVIFTDDGAVVLLEKAAFAQTEATLAFLRDVFARWYKRKG